MGERVVNLNAAERPVVTVEIGDRSFSIRRVVTGVRQLWSAFVVETMAYIEETLSFEKITNELKTQGTAEAAAEIKRLTDEITGKVDGFHGRKLDALYEILSLLITKNGYDFDRDWWMKNTDEADCRDFIIEVLSIDSPVKKKPEMAAPSTGGG